MKKQVFVTFEYEGWHSWPNAPQAQEYLRNSHRHLFNFKIWYLVNHNDREIEFIAKKMEMMGFVAQHFNKYDFGSCESVAEAILNSDPIITRVVVSEDGENGADLER